MRLNKAKLRELRIYYIKPDPSLQQNPNALIERLRDYLGPALINKTGWGLLRPGLLTEELIKQVEESVRRKREAKGKPLDEYTSTSPDVKEGQTYSKYLVQREGDWIFFDYLFSKPINLTPIIGSLASVGLVKYRENIRLTNTYLVTVGLNYKNGLLIMFYQRRNIKRELDDLAYVFSHLLKSESPAPEVVEITRELTIELATYLVNRGWVAEDCSVPRVSKETAIKDIENIRQGEWKRLCFRSGDSEIILRLASKRGKIKVKIEEEFYSKLFYKKLFHKDWSEGNLRVFDELAKGIMEGKAKGIVDYKGVKQRNLSKDKAGILRAYTERRGVMAVLEFERREGREAFDESYKFEGYDVRTDQRLIEVKAFESSASKKLRLTENEYKVMKQNTKYSIYVVEDAWNDKPAINIIDNPERMKGRKKKVSEVIGIEPIRATLEYFEYDEQEWRRHAKKVDGTINL